jgi:hypothetical protein
MNKLSKQECLPDFTETLPAVGAVVLLFAIGLIRKK